MNDADRRYMEMAVEQARKQLERFGFDEGGDRPAPKVGCVIVTSNGKVEVGFRGEREQNEHAEFTVMEKKMVPDVLVGATVYTTLEPCTDRNPPKKSCAERLIQRRVGRVVIGMLDPDRRGQGVEKLRDARIVIELFPDDLAAEVEELNRKFIESRRQAPAPLGAGQDHRPLPDSTVAEHLKRLGVPRDPVFTASGYFMGNPDRKCIESIISIDNLYGVVGVPGEKIIVEELADEIEFPAYVETEIARTQITGRDGNKAGLRHFRQQPLDVNLGQSTLGVSLTKYRTKIAMRAVRPQIVDDLVNRRLRIVGDCDIGNERVPVLPCHLHCDGVVITSDQKVLLAQRSVGVDLDAYQWASSFGEGVEWDRDRYDDGKLHPLRTVWRGLEEELGLSESWMVARFGASTRITFLELGFQVDSLIYVLFSMIELSQLTATEALARARNYRTDKEPRAFDLMDFSPSQCASAIVTGFAGCKKLNHAGRFGLLLASLNKFDASFTLELARLH